MPAPGLSDAIDNLSLFDRGAEESGSVIVIDDNAARGEAMVRVLRTGGFAHVELRSAHMAAGAALTACDVLVLELSLCRHDAIEFLYRLAARAYRGVVALVHAGDARTLQQSIELARRAGLARVFGIRRCNDVSQFVRAMRAHPATSVEGRARNDCDPMDRRSMLAALREGKIALHYQPQVAVASGHVVSAEALLRWQLSNGGMQPAASFVHLFEHEDVREAVATWTLATCARDLRRLRDQGRRFRVSLNVDARDLCRPGAAELLLERLSAHSVSPDDIVVEVTETAKPSDEYGLSEALTRLRLRGVRLSLDDFGKGFSTVERLLALPFTELKIDSDLTRCVGHDPRMQDVIAACVSIGHAAGAEVIGEGVETPEQLSALARVGCDGWQGYLLARPVGIDELSAVVDAVEAAGWNSRPDPAQM